MRLKCVRNEFGKKVKMRQWAGGKAVWVAFMGDTEISSEVHGREISK